MKELQRLVRIVDKFSLQPNPLINLQNESTLETKLFHLLKGEAVCSDEFVAKQLYGDEKLSSSFRTLKSRFRKKIFNHLHFLELAPEGEKGSNELLYQCMSLLTEAYALSMNSEIKLSLKVYDQILNITNSHDLNEIKIKALEGKKRVLLNLAKEKEFFACDEALYKCYEVQRMERRAISLYESVMLALRGPIKYKFRSLEYLPAILDELQQLYDESNSSLIMYHRHVLNISMLEQSGKYSEIVDAIAQIEHLIASRNIDTSWFNKKYNSFTKVYALLQTKQYDEGLDLAAKSLPLFTDYSVNWFAFMENYVLLAIHSRNYKLARQLLNKVINSGHVEKLNDSSIERWELYRRYFVFLLQFNTSEPQENNHSVITSELLILPKDKAGFNLALLVLDVLEKLSEEQTDDLEVQIERVRKYTQKYLKGEKAERPRLFMRLLLLALTKQNAEEAQEQGQKLLEKLQVAPLPGDAFTEVEIVPYEHLWELALQLLQKPMRAQ